MLTIAHRLLLLLALLVVVEGTIMPASATVYQLKFSGTVQKLDGNLARSSVAIGDAIVAAFNFDTASASGPSMLTLGGGTYSIYDAPLTAVSVAVGGYTADYPTYASTLSYMDNSFGNDGIAFVLDGLSRGPLSSVQFQARGPLTAIDESGIENGLPFGRLVPSFFAIFGAGATAERVYGSLSITDAAAVPEPASWAMIIFGFGLVGGALRRRQQKVRASVKFA